MSTAVLARAATRPAHGVAMVLVAGTLFAINGTVSKLLLRIGFDAPQLTTFRATGAFFGLLILSVCVRPGARRLKVSRRALSRLTTLGLTGFLLVPTLYFVTISRLPVGIGLLIQFTGPVFVALWLRFGEGARVGHRLWVGLALCLGGLFCVAQIWAGEMSLDLIGVIAGLVSAVFLAVYYVLGSRTVRATDPLAVTCWGFGVSAAAGAIIRPWGDFPAGLLSTRSGGVPVWLLAGYLVIFGTITSYLLVSASMRHLPPTSVGIIGMVEPVLASAFAWLVLAEVLTVAQILGGLLVLGGVVLAETARPADATARTPTPEIPPT